MSFVWPFLIAISLWWVSTGLVLIIDRRAKGGIAVPPSIGFVALALLCGLVAWSAQLEGLTGVYLGFVAGIAIWGWHEIAFLSGRITGPDPAPCPPGATGWRRFKAALGAILWHEMAIAVTALALYAFCRGGENMVGLWTFNVLWIMRLSAKINVFLGVPNMTLDLLPDQVSYLKTYFRVRPMNWLFPFSVTLGTIAAAWFSHGAFVPGASEVAIASSALLSGLTALAVLEHWFLVLPIRDAALWHWWLGADELENSKKVPSNGVSAEAAP
ncbi:MAG: putative photosynthetic complex assembly protein PuhE [Pseudomonadota bacterium]